MFSQKVNYFFLPKELIYKSEFCKEEKIKSYKESYGNIIYANIYYKNNVSYLSAESKNSKSRLTLTKQST